MKIVKRDGRLVDFEVSKIKQSILGASEDANFSLNESDLSILANSIKDKLNILCKNNRITSSLEIRMLVFESLLDNGFSEIAKSYISVR